MDLLPSKTIASLHKLKENDFQNSAWSLLDDDVLEETICLSTLSSEAHLENKEKIWQLDQRLSHINDDIDVSDSNNPLSPIQFFIALRSALRTLPLSYQYKTNELQNTGKYLTAALPQYS